ncbi:MAG TPA: zinc-binding dehydrogenase [Bosea sp. (in: a-proteobacteria)]|uniref:zinc-binding dehydrogenase n=1 Tax=Bosea sp. (in: a-proteobacteria) TaxID=1871050 RepID=UPI002DDCEBAB|nr:zinc-binding dehydrogenase [Bosea sp. (in: a-proteobacteria)]HEV2552953.1 zinc-binding dehydrogenase [Bosea sp. (in: a-proteobacteria)]
MQVKKSKGAIVVQSREPLVVDEFDLPETLGVGHVLVKIHYTSICGAQINEIAAVKGPDKFLPHLLGHEASGTVIDVGIGVTTKKPGDTVVLHWRPSKGFQSPPPAYSWNGKKLNAGWVTTFNEYAVISENRLTVVPADFDKKVSPLLGCAVTTALGVINNDAQVKIGESVVIFGSGGVGLNMAQCAALVGAHPVIAVDILDSKLEMAKKFGATHVINSKNTTDVAAAIREIVGQAGADKVIETTGVKGVIETAYELTAPKGACVLVGVPTEKVTIYTLPLHFNKILTGSEGGSCVPDIDIPRIIKLNQAGKMSFKGLITHEFTLDQINEALDCVRSGEAGRVLLKVDPSA